MFQRRSFLIMVWGAALAALLAKGLALLADFLRPAEAPGGGKIRAGSLSSFNEPGVYRNLAGKFYLVRVPAGLIALRQRCTHMGCTVRWDNQASFFICPCHGSYYTPVGEALTGPAPRPLDTLPIEIIDGEVWVDTLHPQPRAAYSPDQLTIP